MNNFRRIISAYLPRNEFCNHKVNYCPSHRCKIPLDLLLAYLNSKFLDWYFRLGSSNNSVSHYQLYNLPIPLINAVISQDSHEHQNEKRQYQEASEAIVKGEFDAAFDALKPAMKTAPFSKILADVLVDCVREIHRIEESRGTIDRSARSSLSAAAQPFQGFIDRLLFAMTGLTKEEAEGLEERLSRML